MGWSELVADLDIRLAAVEARAATQTAVVRFLDEAGYDTREAEKLLWGYMDIRTDLRRQRREPEPTQAEP
jgi:hypothetical protein